MKYLINFSLCTLFFLFIRNIIIRSRYFHVILYVLNIRLVNFQLALSSYRQDNDFVDVNNIRQGSKYRVTGNGVTSFCS